MSALDTTLIADPVQILGVAQDVFAALIDDGEVLVHEGVVPESFDVPVTAWVDMLRADSPHGVRTMVRAEEADAHLVVRALLRMEPDEVVGEEDLVDAFGEIANVVGGNLKSLLPEHAELTLPTVAAEPPVLGREMMVAQTPLEWRGSCFVISLWMLV